LAVDKARLRYRSLLLTTNFKVALQVESTICHFSFGPTRVTTNGKIRNLYGALKVAQVDSFGIPVISSAGQ
jgi:hypothetical protein